eukprot:3019483-Amphidinium_carterae.1
MRTGYMSTVQSTSPSKRDSASKVGSLFHSPSIICGGGGVHAHTYHKCVAAQLHGLGPLHTHASEIRMHTPTLRSVAGVR